MLLTSGDVGVRKPEPAGYVALAHRLGVEANELLYVGNEQKDIVGAHAAGSQSALLISDGPVNDWGQTVTLSSLDQLLAAHFSIRAGEQRRMRSPAFVNY